MSQTPSILGQNYPEPAIDTILFTVGPDNDVQFSVFVANQSPTPDQITIALVADGGPEIAANYIAYNTAIIGNGVLAFSGLYMNSQDQVRVMSLNGTSSFTATGLLTTP